VGARAHRQPAKKIQEFLVILGKMDRQTQEEIDKAKRENASQKSFR
jgi:hypothetical protein